MGQKSRRAFVSGAIATAAIGTFAGQSTPALAVAAAMQGPATPDADAAARVEAPRWAFQVQEVQDPYTGTLQVPQDAPAGSRVVAIEIEVTNDADQSLNFTPIDVRLRDMNGTEHRGGAAIGAEPMINPRNLNPGERSRGWVWFIIPLDTVLAEVVYVAPQPQFRVPLST
jgi:hypothetical protein